jgi:hypothetical protein
VGKIATRTNENRGSTEMKRKIEGKSSHNMNDIFLLFIFQMRKRVIHIFMSESLLISF